MKSEMLVAEVAVVSAMITTVLTESSENNMIFGC